MSNNKHLNPFYIEPNQNLEDFYNDNEEDDEEWNDLLRHTTTKRPNHGEWNAHNNHWQRQPYGKRTSTFWSQQRGWILMGCILVTLILLWTHPMSTTGSKRVVPVQRIAVLGERNSGTDWLESKLHECFPSTHITSTLQRKGYFFQTKQEQEPTTLVVALFLNSYEWVQLMRERPMYAPFHNASMPWETYVTTPWTMPRPSSDGKMSNSKSKCQHDFDYNQVVPCQAGTTNETIHHGVYELQVNGNGKPYRSIVNLRSDKILNFMETTLQFRYVSKVLPVQYESLHEVHHHDGHEMPGLWHVLQDIHESTGLNYTCNVMESGMEYLAPPLHPKTTMSQAFVDWMNAHVNWATESMVGYTQWQEPAQYTKEPQEDYNDDEMINNDDDDDVNHNGNSRDDVKDEDTEKENAATRSHQPNESSQSDESNQPPEENETNDQPKDSVSEKEEETEKNANTKQSHKDSDETTKSDNSKETQDANNPKEEEATNDDQNKSTDKPQKNGSSAKTTTTKHKQAILDKDNPNDKDKTQNNTDSSNKNEKKPVKTKTKSTRSKTKNGSVAKGNSTKHDSSN